VTAQTRPTAIDSAQADEIVKRAESLLPPEDHAFVRSLLETLRWLTVQLQRKDASLNDMRRMLFGSQNEKTKDVKNQVEQREQSQKGKEQATPTDDSTSPQSLTQQAPSEPKPKPKRKRGQAHGRYGAADFTGANNIPVSHPNLQVGQQCPADCSGWLYHYESSPQLFLFAQPPIGADLYDLERLRCSACGEIFTAPLPEQTQGKKYSDSVPAMVAMLRFGAGFPHFRLAKLQLAVGIPLPASTQWDLLNAQIEPLTPVLRVFIDRAASANLLHNDDTGMRVISLLQEIQAEQACRPANPRQRTGIFTTGIVSQGNGPLIALFITGRQHAGENLRDILLCRAEDLSPVMQMCDGLERNLPKQLETIVLNCLSHGRRHFAKVAASFPSQCLHVLEQLALVYEVDALARDMKMDAEARLRLHQRHSKPVMDWLKQWMLDQLDLKKVEPNSGLGKAINYMLKRWTRLTQFLRVAGAALDNNICERALKKAVLHRKNSMSYKTERGARAGDLFMSLIHTAELNGVDPLHYLTSLMGHQRELADSPERWMPWNYTQTLQELGEQEPVASDRQAA